MPKKTQLGTTVPTSRRKNRDDLTYKNDQRSLSSCYNTTTYGLWVNSPSSTKSAEKVTHFETKVEFNIQQQDP